MAGCGGHPARHLLVECTRKRVELVQLDGQPRCHRVTAKLVDEVGVTRGNCIQHVANVHSGNGACGSAQPVVIDFGECNYGTTHAFFHAARNETDHALMPALVVEAHAASLQGW